MTPKPVDTGGVEGGGDLWATGFGVVDTALNWFTMNYRTTDDEKAAIAKARQILSTEKPSDSMGGGNTCGCGHVPEDHHEELGCQRTNCFCKWLARDLRIDNAVADAPGDVTESVASDGWRSIDSAPKDGTRIMLARAGKWSTEGIWYEFDRVWVDDPREDHPTYFDDGNEPTHWQPRIAPPPIGEQQTEPATNSVTPQGAQATPKTDWSKYADDAKALTQMAADLKDLSPQQEKREGPWSVATWYAGEIAYCLDGPVGKLHIGRDPIRNREKVQAVANKLNALAQPEGDER